MIRLLHAGLVAAQHQLVLVVLITVGLFTALHFVGEDGVQAATVARFFKDQTATLLSWAYLLVAGGLSCTAGRHIENTAESMRLAAHRIKRGAKHLLEALVAQLILVSFLCAVVLLIGPPQGLFTSRTSTILWSALLSIFVAAFGASAHAAAKALSHQGR